MHYTLDKIQCCWEFDGAAASRSFLSSELFFPGFKVSIM